MSDSLYDKIANALDFRALFDISPVGFALNRLSNGEFLQGNQALFDIVGYTQEEFRRLSYWDITPPKYAEQEQVALEQLKNRGEYGPYYKEYIHKSGELKPVMLRGVKTTDAQGEEYIFSIVADMTEQERARAAEANLGKIIEESLNEIYVVDSESLRFRYANKSAQANIGYSMEELLTMSPLDIIPDGDKAKILGEIKALNEGQTPNLTLQAMHQRKDKTLYDVEARVQLTNFQGKPALVASVLDITERMIAQEQVNKLLKVVEHSPNSIFITDLDGRIEYANEKFEQLNGFTRADYLGKTPAILRSGEMPGSFYNELWDNLKNGRDWRFDVCNRRKDGTLYWAREHVSFVRDKQGRTTHYMSISQDITEIRQQELALQHQARYDQLTGIANRFLGIEQLRESIARSQAAGLLTILLFLDLDNFKYINDNLGHRTGDLILIEAAGRLRTLLAPNDTLARFGGDEFLVILDGIASVAEAEAKIGKIYQQFATAFTVDGIEIHVTLSSGIAVAPNDGTDPDELIRYADSAMYHAKERGRNTFHFFDARISDSAKSRFNLERELRTALEQHELTVYYQPFIDLASGKIVGAEALLRWQNPRLGAVSPNDFIPVAEQTGLIESIGRFVLETATAQAQQWQKLTATQFQMSVNISPRQFRQGKIIADLKELLARYALEPGRIKLEVTEGLLLHPYDNPVEVLNQIKSMGVGVAMDDFGTGYSSLLNLRQFSFDLLKIDRSFIHDLTETAQTRAMVNAIIAMCKSLGLQVIAEGIETTAQRDYLLQQGCTLGQGYLFAKPVPAAEFQRLLGGSFV
ncbi:MAG: sensor domain-containing protein [Spirochaetota bacterium]